LTWSWREKLSFLTTSPIDTDTLALLLLLLQRVVLYTVCHNVAFNAMIAGPGCNLCHDPEHNSIFLRCFILGTVDKVCITQLQDQGAQCGLAMCSPQRPVNVAVTTMLCVCDAGLPPAQQVSRLKAEAVICSGNNATAVQQACL
jgi:hypothetical protein